MTHSAHLTGGEKKISIVKDPIFKSKIKITFGKIENRLGIDKNWGAFFERIEIVGQTTSYHIHFDYYGFTAVVHECHHATFAILSDRGINLDESTKEIYAYYLDWLSGRCRDLLEIWNKK